MQRLPNNAHSSDGHASAADCAEANDRDLRDPTPHISDAEIRRRQRYAANRFRAAVGERIWLRI